MNPATSELLVVSDLHLGGALRPPFGFRAMRQVVKLDRELCRFLDYQRANAEPDTPRTLVLNGDTIDFLHMDVRPEGDSLAVEESLYGLELSEARARYKLQIIVRYHRRSMQGLARFIDAGNKLVFVVGNHDVDLFFPLVREDFVNAILEHSAAPEVARARVDFAPWFYYEEGRVYLEHGHRFDPYATFPDPLDPLDAQSGALVAPNFGHWALRYFCNRVPDFPIHDVDRWRVSDFLRWGWNKLGKGVLRVVWDAITFLLRFARDSVMDRDGRLRNQARRRARRRERLRTFAREHRLPLRRIHALDALRLDHVGSSITRLLQALYLDRLALIALAGGGLTGAVTLPDSGAMTALLTAGILGASFFAWRVLARSRPEHDVHGLLGGMAQRIGRLARVPVVVFGHTHRPVLRRLGRVRWINPGSWEHLPKQKLHGPDETCTCCARFAVISGPKGRTRARLMRWCRRKQQPLALAEG